MQFLTRANPRRIPSVLLPDLDSGAIDEKYLVRMVVCVRQKAVASRPSSSCDTSSVSEILADSGLSILPTKILRWVRRRVAEFVKRSNRFGSARRWHLAR
jgi:hypothetical protein